MVDHSFSIYGSPSIIRTIIRHHRIVPDRIDPDRVAARQERAGLGLVVRGDVVGLGQRLAQDVAVVQVGVLGPDEDADAVLRLGVEIADVAAGEVVDDEAVRRQRVQRLLAGGIVGELRLETGRGEIEAVLVEEGLARRLQGREQRDAEQQHGGGEEAEGFDAARGGFSRGGRGGWTDRCGLHATSRGRSAACRADVAEGTYRGVGVESRWETACFVVPANARTHPPMPMIAEGANDLVQRDRQTMTAWGSAKRSRSASA